MAAPGDTAPPAAARSPSGRPAGATRASSPGRRPRRRLDWLLLAVAATLLPPRWARAGRRFQSPAHHVADFEVPRGWTIGGASPYPGVLLVATPDAPSDRGRPESRVITGARLLLGAQRVVPGTSALALAADARAALVAEGFADARLTPLAPGPAGEDRVRLDARTRAGDRTIAEVLVVDGDALIVLTLAAPSPVATRLAPDFDLALSSLLTTRDEPPARDLPPATTDGGAHD